MWPAGVYAVIGMSATVCEAPPLLHPLQLYNFGETVSLVMWTSSWQPDSYVDKIEKNLQHGLHTLCLLGMRSVCVCVCVCVCAHACLHEYQMTCRHVHMSTVMCCHRYERYYMKIL